MFRWRPSSPFTFTSFTFISIAISSFAIINFCPRHHIISVHRVPEKPLSRTRHLDHDRTVRVQLGSRGLITILSHEVVSEGLALNNTNRPTTAEDNQNRR